MGSEVTLTSMYMKMALNPLPKGHLNLYPNFIKKPNDDIRIKVLLLPLSVMPLFLFFLISY